MPALTRSCSMLHIKTLRKPRQLTIATSVRSEREGAGLSTPSLRVLQQAKLVEQRQAHLNGQLQTRQSRPTQLQTSPSGTLIISRPPTAENLSQLAKATAEEKQALKNKIMYLLFSSFVLSNMDKTNFTVAIIPMALTYGWSPTVAGLVSSAFFYGFLLMQVPGGYLATRLGGAHLLPRGLAVWSAATAAIPITSGSIPALCATRALTGAGEAIAPSSVIDVISRIVPSKERASAVSFTFSGLHIGSIIGLLSSPAIIQAAGWPALFYTFGLAGGLWMVTMRAVMAEVRQKDPELAAALAHLEPAEQLPTDTASTAKQRKPILPSLARTRAAKQTTAATPTSQPAIPYRAFLRSKPVQVLMFTHFCHNWFHYTMLSWLPTYFTSTLSVDLMHAAQTALLPPIAGIAASTVAGKLSDHMINNMGLPLPTVRKTAQSVAFLVPTACLTLAATSQCTPDNSSLVVGCITAALGMSSFSLAGLYCTHGDLSPKYASALLGLTNVAGSLPGIVGVAFVGALYDQTHDWSTALFLPSSALLLLGAGAYFFMGSNDPVDFDTQDNSHFGFERAVRSWWSDHPASESVRRAASTVSSAAHRLYSSASAASRQWKQRNSSELDQKKDQ